MGVSLLYHLQLVLYLREYVGHGGGRAWSCRVLSLRRGIKTVDLKLCFELL
jgi:hypothetical protein